MTAPPPILPRQEDGVGPDAVLRVGGMAPPDAVPAEPAEPADRVTARRYRHPALGDRPVIRLVPEALGRAEDLALESLGLELAAVSPPVALARRRAVGFPGWVLLHHPAEADYALAVVKEMEGLARLAGSRPGAAKDGYEAIARRLARTVPHFLPTYFEQAGRAFIEAGNAGAAGVLFGRAREAERVYALDVDEDRRLAVFLEFALAGALTVRSLADHARQLGESGDPGAAYATFRRLCVERTRAGVAPWADMATQLRRLGGAAGVDLATDEADLLAELLTAPALARAPLGFWKAYRRPLLALARRSSAARDSLLHLHPTVEDVQDWWLGLLDAAGALDALARGPGVAAWLGRTVATATAGWRAVGAPDALFALLPRLAKRLRADAVPITLAGTTGRQTDLDLLDLALELQLPVEPPPPGLALQVQRWFQRPPARRRSLDHLAADPVWGPLLLQALDAHLQHGPAAGLLEGGHLRRGFAAWLDLVADRIEHGGLPDLAAEVARLGKALTPGALAVNPAARDRILGADAARSLARTLRGGCLDELGWPALEQARARLGPDLTASGAWPYVILSDGIKALVVGPDGVLLEHDLRVAPDLVRHERSFLHAGGQLLVTWWTADTGRRGYWSGRPAEVFDARSVAAGWWPASLRLSLELPDGSRTIGGRAIRPGDTSTGPAQHVIGDGTRCWTLTDGSFRELDTATGRTKAAPLPEFLAALDAGGGLVAASSWLAAIPPGLEGNPLGARDGLTGVRARRSPDGGFEAEGVDGRRVTARLPSAPAALVTFPGDARPRPLTMTGRGLDLWDPTGRIRLLHAAPLRPGPDLAPATPVVLPPPYWVALRPRDEAGSAALRAVSDDVAREIVREDDRPRAVERLLPAIQHPELRRSVAAQAAVAADLQRSLQTLVAGLQEPEPSGPDDASLLAAFGWLGAGLSSVAVPPGTSTMRQLRAVERFMETGDLPEKVPASPMQWALLTGRMAAVACRAASPAIGDRERETLLDLLEWWAGTTFARYPERFRVVWAAEAAGSSLSPSMWLRHRAGRRWFIGPRQARPQQQPRRLVLERAHRGSFELPDAMTVEWERVGAASWERPGRISRLVALVRERGPAPWAAERVGDLVRWTGLTRAESALLLAGMPADAPARTMLGLKASEAAAARARLAALPVQWRIELVAAGMPDEPAGLWKPCVAGDPDGPPARIARTWVQAFGRRAEVDEPTVAAARSSLRLARPPAEALAGVSDPASDPRLNTDAAWAPAGHGRPGPLAGSPPEPFGGDALHDLALLIPWLFASRPVGDRARSGVPEALRRGRERLANPDLLVAAGWVRGDDGGRRLLDLVPGPEYRPPRGREIAGSRDAGAFVLVPVGPSGAAQACIRPARIGPAADAGLLRLLGESVLDVYRRVEFLTGAGAEALAERIAGTPVPAGGWEANPAVSAPGLVDEVAGATGLSPEAATLYLQLLAAHDPTLRAIRQWNGWTGAVLERAATELVERRLATRARRARAGRHVFLPGPWEELKAPDLPVETWRLRLYGGRPLGRLLPLRPLHVLFEEAWRLVRAGDGPAFEEITR